MVTYKFPQYITTLIGVTLDCSMAHGKKKKEGKVKVLKYFTWFMKCTLISTLNQITVK